MSVLEDGRVFSLTIFLWFRSVSLFFVSFPLVCTNI